MGGLTVKKKNAKRETAGHTATDAASEWQRQKRYFRNRTILGVTILVAIVLAFLMLIAVARLRLTEKQLFDTNRTRINTVIGGLSDGGLEKNELYDEYDRLYAAKLKNTEYYFRGFDGLALDDALAKAAAEYADIESVAVIDGTGKAYGRWQCDYDFTKKRFAMLRACAGEEGISQPFTIAYEDGARRFFGKRIADDRILVFVKDWAQTQSNIENMTSWDAVLRGMISVDTLSIAVSLKDYSFLYNQIDNLTGKDALQNGVPIESLGEHYEGDLFFGGDRWCAVGQRWNDAVVFVMTRASTDRTNDLILIVFIAGVFAIFASLLSVYGVIINQDNIKLGKMPQFVTLLGRKAADGTQHNLLNVNVSVMQKLLPIVALGVVTVALMTFYIQSVNGLSSIAYESNQAINEISTKLVNNADDAQRIDTEYRDIYLSKCLQITKMLEENPDYVLVYDPEAENVHRQPVTRNEAGQIVAGLDEYGNVCYSVSEQPFLKELCDINAIEKISLFDEQGRIMATNNDGWYFTIDGDETSQTYPFWEILAEHRDVYAQDLEQDEEGAYSQYIGSAYAYYTVQDEEGQTAFVSAADYRSQLDGTWTGTPITRHRGLLQINIAPERLRSVMRTATMNYVAGHTTVHGTGHTVVCDTDADHTCVYSPRSADIGKPAANMGYSDGAFIETGVMYNGFETVNGEHYFQTFKRVDDYDCYIGAAVPLETVYATRGALTLFAMAAAVIGLLLNFVYVSTFSEREERFYTEQVLDAEARRLRNEQDPIVTTAPSGKTRRILSAPSRWNAGEIPWAKKTPEQKFSTICKLVFSLFSYFLFLCILLSRTGVYPINMIEYVFEGVWTKGFNIFAMTNCVITLIVVFIVAKLAEGLIENVCVNIGSRAETLAHLFTSVIHYGVALFALFYTLYLCGLDTGSLIASAGIMSLVIGLGAQSMIQDILAGVFIVFEGAFRVGDIVTIGDFRGSVLEIGLRTTKIQDTARNIKVFNNSTLSGIINMTKEVSVAAVDVGIAYGEDIERVEAILAKELPLVAKRLPAIMDGPKYLGVSALADSSVNIKVIAQCKEQNRLQLCRDLNREMFLIFKKHNINIPFPQVTVSYLEEKEEKADAPDDAAR